MDYMHFCAVVLPLLLTLTLVLLLLRRVVKDEAFVKSSWLLAGGTALVFVNFLLQFLFGVRHSSVTQAAMLNLLMFIPSSWLINLSFFCLQRQGRIRLREWWVGAATWGFASALMLAIAVATGVPLMADTPQIRMAEVMASMVYAAMQFYFFFLQLREMRRIKTSFNTYFDHDKSRILYWMKGSAILLMLVVAFVPFFIFTTGWVLASFGLIFLAGLYYFVISFVCHVVSNDAHEVLEAERTVEDILQEEKEWLNADKRDHLPSADNQRVEETVARWIAHGSHLRNGITIQTAADEMLIPRYKLSAWIKTTDQKLFNPWITHLRIEEAKRMMMAHPEWSNDVIAEQCGFGSRSYFQTVFRKQTGMTPVEYLSQKEM